MRITAEASVQPLHPVRRETGDVYRGIKWRNMCCCRCCTPDSRASHFFIHTSTQYFLVPKCLTHRIHCIVEEDSRA